MSIIKQVRAIIAELDEQQFTVQAFSSLWQGMRETDAKRVYKATTTCLSSLCTRYGEIKAVGKGEPSNGNGKRHTVYQACDSTYMPRKKETTFKDNLIGWRKVYPELFGVVA